MLTTLDHLEHHLQHRQKKNFFSSFAKELKGFSIFFLVVFIINSVFVNAQLYQEAIINVISELTWSTNSITDQNILGSFTNTSKQDTLIDQDTIQKKIQLDYITQTASTITTTKSNDFIAKDITKNNLQENLSSYNLDFNLLPPTDRVIIPSIDINTPLLQSSFNKHIDNITKEDFDKDLFRWVVQYPTTPGAGMGGNTLIFGHTSYESRKKNPYATIFSQLPKLKNGDNMQIIQNGKLYEYEVIGRSIVSPNKVNEEYLKYTNWNYLTLLGCYPIWSDKQRILVIWRLKEV